ncbi:3-keto-5-aminohexanoate cleavage protein [Actinospica sp. MGRD01-02]|uniref:3-keto-5-aminohexanoate cleavage protein n=1 Tax=Actinospica acidithermotolerans TaxID=2828514 RepID=A0A941IIN0_9ACTN|nr:3-keto-5-aminohexanoate cleavage protein [Actinospica acidithermotolerans]MBR7829830.1 3-keto-5-aminohexanoate cleavage protein [Actinospica acidithermotolerans]
MDDVILQATLNGPLTKADHPAVPVTADELAREAAACAREGAVEFHIHPRDAGGAESLDPATVDACTRAVRQATGLPVGVTTAAWIEPDLARRLDLVRQWHEPDYASVNLSEPGAIEIIKALLEAGIGIEAGVWTIADAELLTASDVAERVMRLMIEPTGVSPADAIPLVSAIHEVFDRADLHAPRLQHGEGEAAWILLEDAVARSIDTRIGFEDTSRLPDGSRAEDNAALVRAARILGAGA